LPVARLAVVEVLLALQISDSRAVRLAGEFVQPGRCRFGSSATNVSSRSKRSSARACGSVRSKCPCSCRWSQAAFASLRRPDNAFIR
jgi:hypothetical protein